MKYYLFTFFIWTVSIICTTNNIDVCPFNSYDSLFIQTLKLQNLFSFNSNCILKNNTSISRKVFINNASNVESKSKILLFDQIYNNLAEAFENETRLLSQYLISNLQIILESGDHVLTKNDFLDELEEIFRRVFSNISITADNQSATIRLKSNAFFVFISSNFEISNIVFIGNDINWNGLDPCLVSWTIFCCQYSNLYFDSLLNDSQCYLKNRNLPKIQKLYFYGLFNLEFVADNTLNIQPNLSVINCKFINFFIFNSTGFSSLVSLAPLSGSLNFYSVIIEESFFPEGVIYYSKYDFDPFYSSFTFDSQIQNMLTQTINLYNSSIFDYNVYSVMNDMDIFIFSLVGFNGNISFENCFFSSVVNTTSIFNIIHLGMQGMLYFKNSTINDISQATLFIISNVNFISIDNITIWGYFNLGKPMFYISNADILIANLNLSNFKLDNTSNCFQLIESNLSLNDSFFSNGVFNSFIDQESNSLIIENCSFLQMNFNITFIIVTGLNGVTIEKSSFYDVLGKIYLILIEKTDFLIISEAAFEKIDCYSIFFSVVAYIHYNFKIVLKNSIFGYIWAQDLQILNIITNSSTIINNIITGCFFRDLSIPDLNFAFHNILISGNKFLQLLNSAGMIQTQMGSCTFNKTSFIENYFLNPDVYRYLFEIAIDCYFVTIDCFFKDNGIIAKKFKYFGYNDNNMIALWSIFYSFFNNITILVTDKVELLGGMISASPHSGVFELKNSRLIYNISNDYFEYKGIQLDSFVSATFINNTFYNLKCNSRSFATSYGGICLFASTSYLFSKGQNNYWVYMKNNSFYNSSCINGGGLAVFGVNYITIIDIFVDGSRTDNRGGSLILVGSETCFLQNIFLNDSVGFRGGGFYVQNIFSLQLDNVILQNAMALETGILFIKNIGVCLAKNISSLNTESNVKGGVFFIYRTFFSLEKGNFMNSVANQEGGTLYCDDRSVVVIDQINVTNSFAVKGGVFSIAGSMIFNLTNAQIINGSSLFDAAVFLLEGFTTSTLMNISISNSTSISGRGILYIRSDDDTSMINIESLECLNNSALDGSCILFEAAIQITLENIYIDQNGNSPLYLFGSVTVSIYITNVSILFGKSLHRIVHVSNINLTLNQILVNNNQAASDVFSTENAECIVTNGTFFDNSDFNVFHFVNSIIRFQFVWVNGQKAQMSYLVSSFSNISFISLDFFGGYFNDDSGLFNLISSNFISIHTTFANISGEVFNFFNSPSITFSENIFFNNTSSNLALPNDIYIENAGGFYTILMISASKFEVFLGFSCYFLGNFLTNISDSAFFNMDKINVNKALQILSNSNIFIYNSSFLNFTSSAINVLNTNADQIVFFISNSNFYFNTAPKGSCLNVQGDITISLINCTFFNNSAIYSRNNIKGKDLEGVAPCLFFKPKSMGSSKVFISSTLFENNIAEFIAPTIFSQNPVTFDDLTSFQNNKDDISFTNTVFTFPLEIKLSSSFSESIYNDYLSSDEQQNIVEFNSGTPFRLEFILRDDIGQVLIFDNQSFFTIKKTDSSNSLIILNFMNSAVNGKVAFPKLLVSVPPNLNFSLEVSGLLASLPGEVLTQELRKTIRFHSRNCSIGEIIMNDFSCVKCIMNTYSLDDPMILDLKFQKCYICPDFASCPGGAVITPIAGFYRISNSSKKMTTCLNAESCIGGANDTICDASCMKEIEIHGGCKNGNLGILCSICEINYGKFNEFDTCKQCASLTTLIVFRLIGYLFFMCIYIFFNSYLAEHHDTEQGKTEPNVFLKILINHTQQISLIIMKGVQIPMGNIQSIFAFMNYVSFTNDQVINNECLLEQIYNGGSAMLKIVLNTILPIILSGSSLLIWYSSSYFLKKWKINSSLTSKFFLFTTLSVFMLYPLITKSCLSLLECMRLDPDEPQFFLKVSLDIECWGKNHIVNLIIFSLPGLLIWGIGFPIFLAFVLRNNLKHTSTILNSKMSVSQWSLTKWRHADGNKSFSFFYRGFNHKYYFWESIILLRKFFLCLITTLSDSLLDENKWMIILILLLIFLFYTLKCLPYTDKKANYLECLSLISCAFSIFACFTFNSDTFAEVKDTFVIGIAIINLVFYSITIWILVKLYTLSLKDIKKSIISNNHKTKISKMNKMKIKA